MRGGAVRSSLHTLTSTNNTSTPTRRIEKPLVGVGGGPPKEKTTAVGPTTTDVASVVNLGGAGSRRTVYLDENQIKGGETINRSPSSSINLGQPATSGTSAAAAASTTSSATSSATQPPPPTNGVGSDGSAAQAPTTLLMYNRISNIISPLANDGDTQQGGSDKFGSSSSQNSTTNNNNKGSLEEKEKESAIWYEYGCV